MYKEIYQTCAPLIGKIGATIVRKGQTYFPSKKSFLGRVLGPTKNEGNEMSQSILTSTGRVVPQRGVRRLTQV